MSHKRKRTDESTHAGRLDEEARGGTVDCVFHALAAEMRSFCGDSDKKTCIEDVYDELTRHVVSHKRLAQPDGVRGRMRDLMLVNRPGDDTSRIKVIYDYLPERLRAEGMTAHEIMAYYTIIVSLVHMLSKITFDADNEIVPKRASWQFPVFVMVSYLARCQSPLLDVGAEITQYNLLARIRLFVNEALALLDLDRNKMDKIGVYVTNIADEFYRRQAAFCKELVRLPDMGLCAVIGDIGSWKKVKFTPYKGTTLATCALTGYNFAMHELVRVHVVSYSNMDSVFTVHKSIVPYIEVAHMYVNFGLILTQTTHHIRVDILKWITTVCKLFADSSSSLASEFYGALRNIRARMEIGKWIEER